MLPPTISPTIPIDQIDPDAQKVLRRLTRNGFEAYMVGGCVRDLLLARKPKDFDLATSATPSEVRDLFRNCRIIGRRFRLAHVFFGQKIIETATFRANPREVEGAEGAAAAEGAEGAEGAAAAQELLIRRDNVFGTAEEDARRRDFTMNGLFYDIEEEKVIDYVDGLRDLADRSVRTIGDPDIRFQEDPVRILRAIKFAARLGFDIEDSTYRAVITHRNEISKSAPPRVLEEIYRLLRGGASLESFVLLRETGVLGVLIPRVDELLQDDPAVLDPYLSALDALVAAGEVPGNAVLLGALLGPRLAALAGERSVDAHLTLIDESLEPLLRELQATRREAERARQILVGQRRVAQVLKARGRAAALVRTDWFQEALLLHALSEVARGVDVAEALGELAAFRRGLPQERPSDGPGPGPSTVEGTLAEGEGGPRKRRRRRRRRPGARGPAGEGAAEAAEASAGAPGEGGEGDPGEEGLDGDAAEGPLGLLGEDEPVENEEAALDIFAAVMNDRRYDE